MKSQAPKQLLLVLIDIASNNTFTKFERAQACIIMGGLLTPNGQAMLTSIRDAWYDPSVIDQRNRFKLFLREYIFHEDQVIRNVCSHLYALLFGIEAVQWPNAIPDLFEILTSTCNFPFNVFGVLTAFIEILELPIFNTQLRTTNDQYYKQIIHFLPQIYANTDPNFRIDLRAIAIKAMITAIDKSSMLVISEDHKDVDFKVLFDSLQIPYQIADTTFSRLTHSMLHAIFQSYFLDAPIFFEIIYTILLRSLTSNVPPLIAVGLDELQKVIFVEDKIVTKRRIEFPKKEPTVYCPQLFGKLSDVLKQLLFYADQKLDDPDRPPIPALVVQVYSAFYKVAPEMVFRQVGAIYNEIIHDPDQTPFHKSMAIQALSAIAGRVSSPVGYKTISTFLNSIQDDIIDSAMISQPPIIRQSALITLSKIYKNFPKIAYISVGKEKTIERIDKLLQSISPSNDTDQLKNSYLDSLYNFAKAFKLQPALSPFEERFNQISQIVAQLQSTSDALLFTKSSEVMNNVLIYGLPPSQYSSNVLISMLEEYRNKIVQLIQGDESSENGYFKLAAFLSNLGSILLKLNTALEDGNSILMVLMACLKCMRFNVYEETLYTLEQFVKCQGENVTPDQLNVINQNLGVIFSCPNYRVVFYASGLLATIYKINGEKLIESASSHFNNMVAVFKANDQPYNPALPSILQCLTNIIKTEAGHNENHSFDADFDTFQLLIRTMIGRTFLIEKLKGEEFGNLYAKFMTHAMRVYFKLFVVDRQLQNESQQEYINEIVLFFKQIMIIPDLEEPCIKDVSKLLIYVSKYVSRKNNTRFNKGFIHKTLQNWNANCVEEETRILAKKAFHDMKKI